LVAFELLGDAFEILRAEGTHISFLVTPNGDRYGVPATRAHWEGIDSKGHHYERRLAHR